MQLNFDAAYLALNSAVSAAVAYTAAKTDMPTARVIVGGAVGFALAVALFCAVACCRVACVACRPGSRASQREDDTRACRVDEDDGSQYVDPPVEDVPDGGYRSDSSSDDLDEEKRVVDLARKRARRDNGV